MPITVYLYVKFVVKKRLSTRVGSAVEKHVAITTLLKEVFALFVLCLCVIYVKASSLLLHASTAVGRGVRAA